MSSPNCPLCNGTTTPAFRFRAVDGPYRDIVEPHWRNFLRCDTCEFVTVESADSELLKSYYNSLPPDYHEVHDRDVSRYRQITAMVEELRPKRILDFGCGNGAFLENIAGQDLEKYGVEFSDSAAQTAARRGITLLPEEILASEMAHQFDVVTAIDVVEHATDVIGLRSFFARLLKPGGHLILLTGNLRSPSAILVGRFWYYMHFAEHLNFFSDRAIRSWLQPTFRTVELIPTNHHPLSYREALSFAKIWSSFPLKLILRRFDIRRVSLGLPVRNDHMIVRAVRTTVDSTTRTKTFCDRQSNSYCESPVHDFHT